MMRSLIFYACVPIICIGVILSIPQELLKYVYFFEHLTLCTLIIYWALEWSEKYVFSGRVDPFHRAVLITGCGSGFGHAFTKKLDAEGYTVFAGVRNIKCDGAVDLQRTCSSRTQVIEMDVSKDESVKEAFEYVKKALGEKELWAVVNNAGIIQGCNVEFTSMDMYKNVSEINTFGVIRVTKTFLPLLHKSRGRMIAINSPLGRMPFPFLSAYNQSKAASICFCDTLRMEVHAFGIKVISIEPDMYSTSLTEEQKIAPDIEDSCKSASEDLKKIYGTDYEDRLKIFRHKICKFGSTKIYQVVDDLHDAVSLLHPKTTYKTRRNFFVGALSNVSEQSPTEIVQFFLRTFFSNFVGSPLKINRKI